MAKKLLHVLKLTQRRIVDRQMFEMLGAVLPAMVGAVLPAMLGVVHLK